MKNFILFLTIFVFSQFVFAQETSETAGQGVQNEQNVPTDQTTLSEQNSQSLLSEQAQKIKSAESQQLAENSTDEDLLHKPGESKIPAKKRPQKQDSEKIDALDEEYPDTRKENADTLKYGMEDDIVELLNNFVKNEDVRFVDEVYDLFEETKNSTVREKILEYFTKLKDPCLEDYALTILNDPYDEKKSTVDCVFRYVQAVKTKDAIPAVLTLLEGEDEDYFNNALTTLGEIGGPKEAVYLTEYLDREDLTVAQKQQLVKVLGNIKAVETYDRLVEMAQDEDENTFVRMYATEAIGSMEKEEAVEIIVRLYEENDPKLRCSAVKALTNFKENESARKTILQAVRDAHVSVRLEAIDACKKNEIKEAVPYLIYRLEKDKEDSVKKKCYTAMAFLNTKEGNDYLVNLITDKKTADTPKSRAAQALLECNNAGTDEIIALARETLTDDRRKPLRYALGKEFAKYKRSEFAEICKEYITSKDTSTQGTGLDIYSKGRYSSVTPVVRQLVLDAAKNPSKKNSIAEKAKKILGSEDSAVIEAKKVSEEELAKEEAKKKAEAEKKASGTKLNSSKNSSNTQTDAK